MKNRIVITTGTISITYGGKTKAIIERANMLVSQGYEVVLVTTNNDLNDLYAIDHIKRRGELNNDVQFVNYYSSSFVNIFDNFLNYMSKEVPDYKSLILKVHDNKDSLLLNGKQRIVLQKTASNRYKKIDFYRPNEPETPYKRIYLDPYQNVRRTRQFQQGTWEKKWDTTLDAEFNVLAEKGPGDRSGAILESVNFDTDEAWLAYRLDTILHYNDIVINDEPLFSLALNDLKYLKKRIHVFHMNHLTNPQDVNSTIRKPYEKIMKRIGYYSDDLLVVLTEQQKSEILDRYPEIPDQIVIIPHAYETTPKLTELPISLRRLRLQNFKSKLGMNMTMRHIGVVTRLVQGKRVDEAIKAFALITEKYPNYTFDVYGSGDEESELKELVKQLGLEERVRFMGYVSDTDTVYRKLDFTVMTSAHEGFALSVLESIANGTPVISYPVKYGPSSIIDGIAGRVTNTRNVNELADLMKKEIEHPTSRLIVSQRAKFYSFEKYKENWLKVLS